LYDTDQSLAKGMSDITLGEETLSIETRRKKLKESKKKVAESIQKSNNSTKYRLMINLGDAGGRIMYSYKELSELAGYTDRVFNMIHVMNELSENRFIKPVN
jgi:pyrrolidone-carboxylate peptidase